MQDETSRWFACLEPGERVSLVKAKQVSAGAADGLSLQPLEATKWQVSSKGLKIP